MSTQPEREDFPQPCERNEAMATGQARVFRAATNVPKKREKSERRRLMNKWKICSALLALATAFLFAPSSSAQSIPIAAVGSSALFPSAAIAAVSSDPVRGTSTPLCGSHFWTGGASAIDARKSLTAPVIPDEGGNLWVAWDNDAAPTIICAYLSVDTIVGQRLFFGRGAGGNATLSIPTSACTQAARGG